MGKAAEQTQLALAEVPGGNRSDDAADASGDRERRVIESHPSLGERIIAPIDRLQEVRPIVRHCHERWDGRGYPAGVAGEDIPLESRIIAVADSYDAMTTTRPYRVAMPHEEAVRRLQKGAGRQWDPRVVATFVHWAQEHENRTPILAVQAS